MNTAVRLVVAAALLLGPSLSAQEVRFGLWTADELAKRDAVLSKKGRPGHSSRETLADYGHRLGPGDVVHIPAGIPHSFLVPEGKHITYVLVKFPKD